MNLSDLSKIDIKNIDLKNIDINKLKDQLLDRKELLVQVVLVLVTFLMVLSIFNKSQAEVKRLNTQIAGLKAKENDIKSFTKSRDEIKAFSKNVPTPLLEDQVIGFITDLADKHKIKILTISPAKVDNKESLSMTTLQFALVANEYKDMVRFITSIEHSKNLLQIKSCIAGADSEAGKDGNRLINFSIEVVSVRVKL